MFAGRFLQRFLQRCLHRFLHGSLVGIHLQIRTRSSFGLYHWLKQFRGVLWHWNPVLQDQTAFMWRWSCVLGDQFMF